METENKATIHVEIKIAARVVNTVHIIRWEGGSKPESINLYKVILGDEPQSDEEWDAGIEFKHRYGDGAEVCTMKALEALTNAGAFFKVRSEDNK